MKPGRIRRPGEAAAVINRPMRYRHPMTLIAGLVVLGLCLGACSKSSESSESDCEASWREPDMRLNPGYVLLYQSMDAFSGMDKVLLIKKESDDEFDLKGQAMPDVIADARKALGEELRETVGGPFKGATGSELERSLLLALHQGLSESHTSCAHWPGARPARSGTRS